MKNFLFVLDAPVGGGAPTCMWESILVLPGGVEVMRHRRIPDRSAASVIPLRVVECVEEGPGSAPMSEGVEGDGAFPGRGGSFRASTVWG